MEGNLETMGALIGAGLACTGMGGAAIGVGPRCRQLPFGSAPKPVGRRISNGDAVYRNRVRGSLWDILLPGCPSADVRALIARSSNGPGPNRADCSRGDRITRLRER